MKGDEYEKATERLDLSKTGAADFLDVNYTTSKRWMYNRHPVPRAVEMLLRLMIKYKVTVAEALSLVRKSK